MLLLVVAQQFLVKPQPAEAAAGGAECAGSASAAQAALSAAPAPAASTLAVAALKAESESTTVVENDLYRITFTNRGGLVKSWILKKYQGRQRPRTGVGARAGRGAVWLSSFAVELG